MCTASLIFPESLKITQGSRQFSDGGDEISNSSAKAKKVRTRKELSSEDKKKIIINWHKTNQMLFGPVVEEKKTKKTKEASKTEKPNLKTFKIASGTLIPINIWTTTSPQSFRPRRIIRKKSDVTDINGINVCNLESIANPKLQTNGPIASLVQPIAHAPQTPFYVKEEILYPFPFMINKPKKSTDVGEIISLPSQNLAIPSITEVLSKTRSESSELALAAWRRKKIAEVGEDGLEEFMRGTLLHTSIETCLRGVQYENVAIDSRISGHWHSLKNILKEMNDIVAVESYVVHPYLQYKGFVDCIAHYKGSLVVVDWKTSQRIKTTLAAAYDDPVQIAAYVGALNADDNYPFEVENALLVVAYPTGRPADVLYLNREECNRYWVEWLKRLELYEHRRKQGLLNRISFT